MIETVVTRKFQITIPKAIREKLKIKVGDRLLISIQNDKIILKPIRENEALARLANIADKYLSGPQKINAVKLVEESLERETGIH